MANNNDITCLQRAITDMDALSQVGFDEIAEIARLAIKSLESNQKPRGTSDIIHALNVIWTKADDIQNCINGEAEAEAEDVECNYVSETTQQRINEALEVNNHEQ